MGNRALERRIRSQCSRAHTHHNYWAHPPQLLKSVHPTTLLHNNRSHYMMLKLKLQYFGHLVKSWLIGKDSDAGRDWGQEEKGTTEDEMAGWHHWPDGRESEWTPGVGDGQGGLACCNSWGCKESDMTEWLNWTELTMRSLLIETTEKSMQQRRSSTVKNKQMFKNKQTKNL